MRIFSIASIVAFFLGASPVLAVFDIQIFGGAGQSEFSLDQVNRVSDDIKLKDESLGITVHANPLQFIPVAIGIGYSQEKPKISVGDSEKYRQIEGNILSLEVMSWLPLGGYALYVKVGQVLSGMYKVKLHPDAAEALGESPIKRYKLEGYHLALGVGFAAAPGMGVFTEIRAKLGSKLTETRDSGPLGFGLTETPLQRGALKSMNLVVGIEMGI